MIRIRCTSSAIALVFAATSLPAQTPALDAAAQAMGGKTRLLAVKTVVLEGTGTNLNFGQNHTPYAETVFEVTAFKRSIDFPNRRWFLDQTRVPKFVTANTTPQRQRQGLDGAPDGIAYNIGGGPPPAPGAQPPATMSRVGGQASRERIFEFLYHPIGFLAAANIADITVTEEAAGSNKRVVWSTPDVGTVAMLVDGRTNLPIRTERLMDQPMLGDVTLYNEFSDWRDVGGLKLPMRITQKYENLFTLSDIRLTSHRVDEDVGNIGVTDSIRSVAQAGQPAPATPPAPTIVVDTLAPGVWRIAGQTHHTIAIELSDQVVLVEAPQSDARTLAAIAKARELRPAKKLDLLINTHHHFDHAGGIRAAISQGLTIVTHEGNKDFYEKVVYPRRHTMTVDALAQNAKPLKIKTVGQTHVINDPMRKIEVHHAAGNPHNGNMLVVYLPAEKILIQADLYNPPAANAPTPSFPFAANLLELIQKKRLQVDRVVGIHGTPVTFAEFQAAATRAP